MSEGQGRKDDERFEAHFGEVDVPPPPEEIEIWAPGATAHLGDIEVRVLSANVERAGVSYKVAWVVNGDRKECWVQDFELRDGSERQRVGFRYGGPPKGAYR